VVGCGVEAFDIGVRIGHLGQLIVTATRFEGNVAADVQIPDANALECVVHGNQHDGAPTALISVDAAVIQRHTILSAASASDTSKNFNSAGLGMTLQRWAYGRAIGEDWYNAGDSTTNPLFAMRAIGGGSAYTNLFGESITLAEVDLLARTLGGLKLGSAINVPVAVYQAGSKKIEMSNGQMGFFGVSPVDRQAAPAGTDAQKIQAIIDALKNLGLTY
jgi:hypothetical protein